MIRYKLADSVLGRYEKVCATGWKVLAAVFIVGLASQSAFAQLGDGELQRSVWKTSYEAMNGQTVQATVVFTGPSGYYDIPGARGRLSNVQYKFSDAVPGNATVSGNWTLGNVNGKFTYFVTGNVDASAFSGSWQSAGRSGNWSGDFVVVLPQAGGGSSGGPSGINNNNNNNNNNNVVYGNWQYNGQKDYYYRKCSFPAGGYQYVIYYKTKPNWVYWYNPDKQVYWCACPTVNHPRWGGAIRNGKDLFLVATEKSNNVENCTFPDAGDDGANFTTGTTKDKDGSTVNLGCPPSDLP